MADAFLQSLQQAKNLICNGSFLDAESILIELQKNSSYVSNISVLTLRAEICQKRREYQQAIKFYTQALKKNKNLAPSDACLIHFELGKCLMWQGDFQKAVPHLKRFTGYNKENYDALTVLAQCYQNAGDPENAMHVVKRALSIYVTKSTFCGYSTQIMMKTKNSIEFR